MANLKSFRRLSSMLPSRSKSLSGPSGPKGPVLIEGLLEKKKTFGSSKFFCSLRDGKLWYSEDKGRESLIDISHAQSVREGKARFSFEIITSSRTHTFVADSQPTRDKWIACLREVMRVSSRKNSTLSYIEGTNSDEETGAASNPRSSVASQRASSSGVKALNSPTGALKPGFGASLPAGLTNRTPPAVLSPSPSVKDRATDSGRTSELKPVSESASASLKAGSPTEQSCFEPIALEQEASKGDGDRVTSNAQAVVPDGARKEINERREEEEKDDPLVLSRNGKKESVEAFVSSSSCFPEEEEEGPASGMTSSKDESGDDVVLTRSVANGDAAGDDSPVGTTELVSMSPSSLYANNADIKKFLNEQKSADHEEQTSNPQETESERKGRTESTAEPELEISKDTTRNEEDDVDAKAEEEEGDDIFSPYCSKAERNEDAEDEVRRPPVAVMPVLRRQSQPLVSLNVDPPESEPESVELDVDFCRQPIPCLPHPRIEDDWSSAFIEMRAIISTNSQMALKEDSALTSVFKDQPGCAVDSLKHFLKNIECR